MREKIDLVIFGDSMIDRYIYCHATELSQEAPIPKLKVDKIIESPGGAGNVMQTLVDLNKILDLKLKIKQITPRKECIKTRVCTSKPFRQATRFDEDKFSLEEDRKILIESIRELDINVAVIADHLYGGFEKEMLSEIRKASSFILADPKGNDPTKYEGIDILVPNEKELNILVKGIGTALEKVEKLKEITGADIILKRGGKGCWFLQDELIKIGPDNSYGKIVDPIGAGDAFISALAIDLFIHTETLESVQNANSFAGKSVTRPGCYKPEDEDDLFFRY